MSATLDKCPNCRALLDEEDIFCANCGLEAPGHGRPLVTRTVAHAFLCRGCGASMSYDAALQRLRCPFCGADELGPETSRKEIAAQRIVPFRFDREEAVARLRDWLGRGFWRPGDLARAAVVEHMQPVFLPFWVFEAETFTHYTADSSRTPAGARGDWYPVSGSRRGHWRGLLVSASAVLSPAETNDLGRFDLAAAIPPELVARNDAAMEAFQLTRRTARPRARSSLEAWERTECVALVPGRVRNLQVNVLVQGMRSEPICLPVWICAYRYRGKLYRFLVNGQTGHIHGGAPLSLMKIAVALLLGLAALALLALLLLFFFALGG